MTTFKFMQAITCPRGPGHFIGYMSDGRDCQITRWKKRDDKNICVNEIYAIGEITARNSADQNKVKPANKIIPVDVASV